jgi:hypothetical protein
MLLLSFALTFRGILAGNACNPGPGYCPDGTTPFATVGPFPTRVAPHCPPLTFSVVDSTFASLSTESVNKECPWDRNGGACYLDSLQAYQTECEFVRTKFSSCSAFGRGGALFVGSADRIAIEECLFSFCKLVGTDSQWGAACFLSQSDAIVVKYTQFLSNSDGESIFETDRCNSVSLCGLLFAENTFLAGKSSEITIDTACEPSVNTFGRICFVRKRKTYDSLPYIRMLESNPYKWQLFLTDIYMFPKSDQLPGVGQYGIVYIKDIHQDHENYGCVIAPTHPFTESKAFGLTTAFSKSTIFPPTALRQSATDGATKWIAASKCIIATAVFPDSRPAVSAVFPKTLNPEPTRMQATNQIHHSDEVVTKVLHPSIGFGNSLILEESDEMAESDRRLELTMEFEPSDRFVSDPFKSSNSLPPPTETGTPSPSESSSYPFTASDRWQIPHRAAPPPPTATVEPDWLAIAIGLGVALAVILAIIVGIILWMNWTRPLAFRKPDEARSVSKHIG